MAEKKTASTAKRTTKTTTAKTASKPAAPAVVKPNNITPPKKDVVKASNEAVQKDTAPGTICPVCGVRFVLSDGWLHNTPDGQPVCGPDCQYLARQMRARR